MAGGHLLQRAPRLLEQGHRLQGSAAAVKLKQPDLLVRQVKLPGRSEFLWMIMNQTLVDLDGPPTGRERVRPALARGVGSAKVQFGPSLITRALWELGRIP